MGVVVGAQAPAATRGGTRSHLDALCIGLVFVAGVTLCMQVFSSNRLGARPQIEDEFVYLFQAKTLANGHLTYPSPPLPEFFEAAHLLVVPRFAAKYLPGHALVLLPFLAAGVAWLGPCLLLGATAALLFVAAPDRIRADRWLLQQGCDRLLDHRAVVALCAPVHALRRPRNRRLPRAGRRARLPPALAWSARSVPRIARETHLGPLSAGHSPATEDCRAAGAELGTDPVRDRRASLDAALERMAFRDRLLPAAADVPCRRRHLSSRDLPFPRARRGCGGGASDLRCAAAAPAVVAGRARGSRRGGALHRRAGRERGRGRLAPRFRARVGLRALGTSLRVVPGTARSRVRPLPCELGLQPRSHVQRAGPGPRGRGARDRSRSAQRRAHAVLSGPPRLRLRSDQPARRAASLRKRTSKTAPRPLRRLAPEMLPPNRSMLA